MKNKTRLLIVSAMTAFSISSLAAPMKSVTVTNLTKGQPLTPPVVIVHPSSQTFFANHHKPSNALALLAEDGVADGFKALEETKLVDRVYMADGPVKPGESKTLMIAVPAGYRITVLSMLATTNDGFTGVSSVPAPTNGYYMQYMVPAYDAGSEKNTEECAHIPGPPCGSHGVRSTAEAEGLIKMHTGIQGTGDLDPAMYGWKGDVAKIRIGSAD